MMKGGLHRYSSFCLAITLVALPATAAELSTRRLDVGTFGTVGMVYHDQEGLGFRRGGYQSRGAEAGELDFEVDTLAGLQVNAAWSENLELVTQAISRRKVDGNWSPEVTRAFVRILPDSALMLRAGRIGWELYPRLDSRDIGYSYLPIRPPTEILGQAPRDSLDGADLNFRHPVGQGLLSLKAYGGRTGGIITPSSGGGAIDLDGTKLWGGHAEYQYDAWQIRLAVGRLLLPKEFGAFFALFGRERHITYRAVSLAYDKGPLQGRLSFIDQRGGGAETSVNSGFAVFGYRLGELTPFISYSAINEDMGHDKQRTYSLGLRYDFAPGLDLKFQIDRSFLRGPIIIPLDQAMRSPEGTNLTVFGLALDFAFGVP